MRGQNTVATVVIVFLAAILLFPTIQLIYGAANGGWSGLNLPEKFAVVLIPPALFMSLLLVPFRRNEDVGRFRR